jgi:heat shock protein HslJ
MRFLASVVLLVLLTGCAGADKPAADPADEAVASADPLDGSSWRLLHVRKTSVPDGVTITAEFAAGRVSGRAGCNRYFAGYRADGGVLEIGPVGATKMMCPDEVMAWEHEFTASLEAAATYRMEGDRLLIIRADGEHLTFAPALPGS